ncbi:MAG: helix-turn-helix domain-containing protein [Clostridia bacterium]|nr:helix-turn-helix domain-containing protein [Clostridia bacterium]MBR5768226.1 helix-turn-helix domain-containing protein [Clostridia bacterium]
MTDRRFQDIIDGVAGYIGTTAGILGEDGSVLACTDPDFIGKDGSKVLPGGFSVMKADKNSETRVFVRGTDGLSVRLCGMLAFAVSESASLRDAEAGRAEFMRKLILGEIASGAAIETSERLGIRFSEPRKVYAVRVQGDADTQPYQVLSRIFPENDDFVVSVGGDDYAVITGAGASDGDEANETAASVVDVFGSECFVNAFVGVGTTADDLGMLGKSYSNALFALGTARLFSPGKPVACYGSLGVAGLINGLPREACRAFLSEVRGVDQFDGEMLATVQAFFDNGLNVSETARSIFVHRNTLLYRIEKIKRVTGLDIRTFDQAVTLRLALMVRKYLEGTL